MVDSFILLHTPCRSVESLEESLVGKISHKLSAQSSRNKVCADFAMLLLQVVCLGVWLRPPDLCWREQQWNTEFETSRVIAEIKLPKTYLHWLRNWTECKVLYFVCFSCIWSNTSIFPSVAYNFVCTFWFMTEHNQFDSTRIKHVHCTIIELQCKFVNFIVWP